VSLIIARARAPCFWKFGECHHAYAADINLHGGRVVPPHLLLDYRALSLPLPDVQSDNEDLNVDLVPLEEDQADLEPGEIIESQILSMPLT